MTCPVSKFNLPPEFAVLETTTPLALALALEDRKASLDFYIGFQLDGVKKYNNISEVEELKNKTIRLMPPKFEVGDFSPYNADKDEFIAVKVSLSY